MEPLVVAAASFVINILMAGVMWFAKHAYQDLKESTARLQTQLDHVKESYFKKEDFREFKEELWFRLDKMEQNWKDKINELRQP